MSQLLEQIANECFRQGKPLATIIEDLVEAKYNEVIYKSKGALRAGVTFNAVVGSLVSNDNLPQKVAASLAREAQEQVNKEVADEERFTKATNEAIALFKNGVKYTEVVHRLKGIDPSNAEKIATDNQKYYRA
jgi:hypothetical protein